ncbi:hypothetical protein AK830_g10612 [Neonectria ditissima]|uniref:Protein kinase domain-containing protein n=1 Tax=Neonectria ditissima TaxID=78410 RepID=A0A0P7BA45_9HYPO|nr:hypothetical protein AK830_g10612 [Neonectria ditissima]
MADDKPAEETTFLQLVSLNDSGYFTAMDPTPAIIDSIILPHGAFHKGRAGSSVDTGAGVPWSESILNPKNRIQSLDLSRSELWDVDGGEPDRGFFCTVPKFARRKPPLRITTTVPWGQVQYAHVLGESLELDAFFRAGKWRIHHLPLTRHLRKALTHWSNQRPGFEREYESLPFGSVIVVESLHTDFTQCKIRLLPNFATERSWLSLDAFANESSIPVQRLSAMTVAWESLELVSHPHENISIVRISGQPDDTSFVFKALMQDTHYMYHELRLLLSMESHPNIIARPHALVLKRRLGGEPGIAGFLLKLYPGLTLQQRLQTDGHLISMDEKVAWSCQLTSALLHVQTQAPGYFPDFKPNNIVFASRGRQSARAARPVLLDFEQRGTWYTWAPPEVRYVEYLELLASTSAEEKVRERYALFMEAVFPQWTPAYKSRSLESAKDGYNLAWTLLKRGGRAKAQMYALGKVLWCIFEGLPLPDGPRSVESFLEDFNQDQQFPEFHKSPPVIQRLVRCCTAGAPEWGERRPGVVRDGNRIVPWGKRFHEASATETQEAATRWWREELLLAEEFVRYEHVRGEHDDEVPWHITRLMRDIEERPSLEEAMEVLLTLQAELPQPPPKCKSDEKSHKEVIPILNLSKGREPSLHVVPLQGSLPATETSRPPSDNVRHLRPPPRRPPRPAPPRPRPRPRYLPHRRRAVNVVLLESIPSAFTPALERMTAVAQNGKIGRILSLSFNQVNFEEASDEQHFHFATRRGGYSFDLAEFVTVIKLGRRQSHMMTNANHVQIAAIIEQALA